ANETDGRQIWCIAISNDGYHWEKPNLGLIEYKGSKKNNILALWTDYDGYYNVIKDPHDPDPQRRYKAMGELDPPPANQSGGVSVAFSPDGVRWTRYPGNPVVHHGLNLADAPTMLGWDHKIKKYV